MRLIVAALFQKRFYILEQMCAIKIAFVLLDLEQVRASTTTYLTLMNNVTLAG